MLVLSLSSHACLSVCLAPGADRIPVGVFGISGEPVESAFVAVSGGGSAEICEELGGGLYDCPMGDRVTVIGPDGSSAEYGFQVLARADCRPAAGLLKVSLPTL